MAALSPTLPHRANARRQFKHTPRHTLDSALTSGATGTVVAHGALWQGLECVAIERWTPP